uniref:Uncharacterized protein n=1 Tax=Romanomermis culicivorax TaxID=13658 RepID=A0A915KGU0_ROMCU
MQGILHPKDVGVLIDHQPAIAIDPQEAGLANPNPDSDGPLQQNMKSSPPKVQLAGPERDVIMPELRPNLDERHPEIEPQLERIPQEQERFCQQERALEMSNQKLGMQLCQLKATVKALFYIIVIAATEDNRREADSHDRSPIDRLWEKFFGIFDQRNAQKSLEDELSAPKGRRDYNIKSVVRIHELNQWFKATFGYWPSNPKEPVLVDMGKVGQILHYIREILIFRGQPVCGFDIEKVNPDKVTALFKTREVDNPMGKQFARYQWSDIHY